MRGCRTLLDMNPSGEQVLNAACRCCRCCCYRCIRAHWHPACSRPFAQDRCCQRNLSRQYSRTWRSVKYLANPLATVILNIVGTSRRLIVACTSKSTPRSLLTRGVAPPTTFRAEWLITNAGPSIAWVPGSDILWGYTHLGKRRLQLISDSDRGPTCERVLLLFIAIRHLDC